MPEETKAARRATPRKAGAAAATGRKATAGAKATGTGKAAGRKETAAKAAGRREATGRDAAAAKQTGTRKATGTEVGAAKPTGTRKAAGRKQTAAQPAEASRQAPRKETAGSGERKTAAKAARSPAPRSPTAATRKATGRKAAAAKPATAEKAAPPEKRKPAPKKTARKPAAARPAAPPKAAAGTAEAAAGTAKAAAGTAKAAAAKPTARKTSARGAKSAAKAGATSAEKTAPTATERRAAAERKADEEQAAAAERKAARRRKAEEEQAAASERRAERKRKAEAEQAAAAERKAERKRKAEAEQAVAAERKAARKQKVEAEEAAAAERKATRKRKAEQIATARKAPAPAAAPPPIPIAEAPVEGKGRHAMVDTVAVASLLGDAADTAGPLTEVLPPAEAVADLDLVAALEQRREEKARRRDERAQRQAERRVERKRAREAQVGLRRGEVVGTITVRPEGYGFLKRLEGPEGDDVFLPPDELRGVMDGDRLRVRIVRGKFGRDAGELLEVLDRRRRHLVGTFSRRGKTTWVIPADPTLPRFVPVRARPEIRDGQVVKVSITQYPDPGQSLLGDVEKVIGNPGDPIVEVLEVAYAHGFAEAFPADVLAAAARIPERVLEHELEGRRDLRETRLVTIDGADARDFDDAVFVERRAGGGYRLVVAIADVAHYVRPGSRLDEEALHRATSVYFPNHVLPMLPERLSNGICSLNPQVDRLCMVADVSFDRTGRPLEAELYEGVMRSHARCTYEQVAQLLAGEPVPALGALRDDLFLAGELAAKLRERRIERGALDFDLPEARPVLDEEMRVVDLVRRPRNDAHRMIEEFMLAANEAVARYFGSRGLPTVYRVHGEPDLEKLENFAALARATGFDFDLAEGITPVQLAGWLRQIEGSAQQQALNSLLLRAMMQAVYTPENIGHFGLGAEHYLHFTSPIRRYPDLIVHRLLKEHWARGGEMPAPAALDELEARLDEIAVQCSQRERAAMEAEREIDAYFKCLFAQEHVGEVHGATIVSVTDFGFFASVDAFPLDGLVRAEELGTQWEFDERRHRLVFGSGASFGVGEHVEIEIAGVDLEKRQIGFVLVTDQRGDAVIPTRRRPAGARPPMWVEAPPPRRGRWKAGRATVLTESIDRMKKDDDWAAVPVRGQARERSRALRGGGEARTERRGPSVGGAPGQERGSRFAAGDRAAAWGRGPKAGRFAPSGAEAESPGGRKAKAGKGKGKGKGGGKKQRPGRRERQARRRH